MADQEHIEAEERWAARAVGLLRIVTALLFLEHGTSKMLGFPETAGSNPDMWSLFWVAGWLELIGGLLLLGGLFTRAVAFVIAGEMAIGYWMVHAPKSVFPVLNGGEAAILFCFIFLLLAATGSGEWSIDGMLRKRRPESVGYRST
ncbi:MAG: DoxX family protein [Pseudomonadota bacterium]|nr:DoxX family protein [Pseudomonadota bacterium]